MSKNTLPDGLTAVGYSGQTYSLAKHLRRHSEARAELRRWLDSFEQSITYSNQDFDQQQGLAAELADWIRSEVS